MPLLVLELLEASSGSFS